MENKENNQKNDENFYHIMEDAKSSYSIKGVLVMLIGLAIMGYMGYFYIWPQYFGDATTMNDIYTDNPMLNIRNWVIFAAGLVVFLMGIKTYGKGR